MTRHPLDPVEPVNPYALLRRGEIDDEAALDLAMRQLGKTARGWNYDYDSGRYCIDNGNAPEQIGTLRAWLRVALIELRARDELAELKKDLHKRIAELRRQQDAHIRECTEKDE